MRAVALSNETVQTKIAESFVPLKVEIPYGTEAFPLDWPALKTWSKAYVKMGGPETKGITGCSVVTPDLQTELGNTGSAFVWEMFDSIAYDAEKFGAMLDSAAARAETEQEILNRPDLGDAERNRKLAAFRWQVQRELRAEGRTKLPPKGFTVEGAIKLFEMSGDLPAANGETEQSDAGAE